MRWRPESVILLSSGRRILRPRARRHRIHCARGRRRRTSSSAPLCTEGRHFPRLCTPPHRCPLHRCPAVRCTARRHCQHQCTSTPNLYIYLSPVQSAPPPSSSSSVHRPSALAVFFLVNAPLPLRVPVAPPSKLQLISTSVHGAPPLSLLGELYATVSSSLVLHGLRLCAPCPLDIFFS